MSIIKLPPYILDSTLDFTFNNVTATGNLVSSNANLGNLATANYLSGNGSLLTGLAGGNVTGQVSNALVAGTVYSNAQPNITSVGTLTSVTTSGDGSIGGNLTVNGNLIVSGTTTTVNSTTVNINDVNIVLANNATTAAQANGAGITINGASANFVYLNTSNAFSFSHPIIADGGLLSNINGSNVSGVVGNATHATVSDSANAVAVANVTGLGNLALINKDGNASNILYGNGVFAAAPAGGGSSYGDSNVASYLPTYTGNLSPGNLIISPSHLKVSGGTSGYVLSTDGTGNLSWTAQTGGGGGSSTLDGLTDVTITSPTNNQVLSYDYANSVWVNKNASSGGTGASIAVSDTAPTSPSEGDLWLDSTSGELNVYFGGAWASVIPYAPQLTSSVSYFVGDSVTTTFTLTSEPISKEYTLVAVGGVLQPKNSYTITGNSLAFTSAVPSNTPIEVTAFGGTASPIGAAATVTASSQPNITSTGTLIDLQATGNTSLTGNLAVTGNLTVNNGPIATTGKAIAMSIVFGF